MTETSTLQRVSNPGLKEWLRLLSEESDTSDEIERPGWRIANLYTSLDRLGSQAVIYPLSPRNGIWGGRGTDEPPSRTQRAPAFAGPGDIVWHQLSGSQSLISLGTAEGLNHHPNRLHSYEPDPQVARTPRMFGLHTSETSDALSNIPIDPLNSVAEKLMARVLYMAVQQKTVIIDPGQERLAAKLRMVFEDEAVEDGMRHPAEEIIDETLRSVRDQPVLDWLRSFCTDASQPSFAASVLRCLGRNRSVGGDTWRVSLVGEGLAIDNVEIRDAAVQAAESWGDPDLLEVLKSHSEPEPWLRQYISDIIEDLAG